MYVQLFCGVIILFFAFLEFNNRNALFLTGEWELSQTQYVVEWVTLLLLLFIIIIYIATTLTYYLRDKYYYLQLFMGSILFFKFLQNLSILWYMDYYYQFSLRQSYY